VSQSSADDYAPSWSPDGGRLAFYRNLGSFSDPDVEIFVMNADGSGQSQVTSSNGQSFYPDWSPDGAQIVFQRYYEDYADIHVMNADGSGVTNITNSQTDYASTVPDWR
jgi:TolB protein